MEQLFPAQDARLHWREGLASDGAARIRQDAEPGHIAGIPRLRSVLLGRGIVSAMVEAV